MTNRGKKIFLALSIIIPFLIYSIVYYAPIIRNAPYKLAEFKSLEYKWGMGNNLENSYNSATGEYRYYDNKDSLVVKNVKLSAKDQKYLDSNAHIQGFYNLPTVMANSQEDLKNSKAMRYFMRLTYENKTKEVTYLADFGGTPKMKDAAAKMQKVIEQVIIDADDRANQLAN